MDLTELSSQSIRVSKKCKGTLFRGMLRERKVFPTPWHWYIHGLGLGQAPNGFDAKQAEQLLSVGRSLMNKRNDEYCSFVYYLLKAIVETCEDMSKEVENSGANASNHFVLAIESIPLDTWQYARACAVLTETLVKLDQLHSYRNIVYHHIKTALNGISELTPSSDKYFYEQAQSIASLLLAAGQAGFWDLLSMKSNSNLTFAEVGLKAATSASDIFYRGRGTAILFSVLAIVDCIEQYFPDKENNYLSNLLDYFDEILDDYQNRTTDGVHEKADFCIFPLSLTLNAISLLGCLEYLTYKRNWIEQVLLLFKSLSPASQASQMSFLVHALDNLGVLDKYIPDIISLFHENVSSYLKTTEGSRIDDYLRCTYLVHLAFQLEQLDELSPRVWSILLKSAQNLKNPCSSSFSAYDSSYMISAYLLSAFNCAGKMNILFDSELDLLETIAQFGEESETTVAHSQRTAFSLIDIGLQMRPENYGDTLLFNTLGLV